MINTIRKVVQVGDSTAIIIPKPVRKRLGIEKGDHVYINMENIRKIEEPEVVE